MTLPERVQRFPWPLEGDRYRYSVNVEPAPRAHRTAAGEWGGTVLDFPSSYEDEIAERAAILTRDPGRHVELEHMRTAAWDALLHLLTEASDTDPAMTLSRCGDRGFHWHNARLGVSRRFRFGDEDSLGEPPLRFAASQVQDDVVLLDERDGRLFADAGVVTFASNWSIRFVLGMSFAELHGPVPRDFADGAIPRAEEFLLGLQPGDCYRRLNWSSTAGHRLDASLESYDEWGVERARLDDLGDLHLRVEVQHLVRLPLSGSIMFLIRTYLLPMREVALVPAWREQFATVLAELPDEMADYKGYGEVRPALLGWLRR
ncbi:DUF3445 domain-containing protein [Saccharopolyspora rhizosphaerae]|uniref:DUF3445 domain-containing protein n=1 Tax=Saccharopolyspora rhizosphaerae TaxID=2492662 RepID=A0A426JXS1_9PSEU|nr:DUF3445 domain-containing protein [Saccharopolyspora rhizosphaerae]RRO18020.1 DUF3445 domain-containing protein [Saccharopolyspora rhizosphaerae]